MSTTTSAFSKKAAAHEDLHEDQRAILQANEKTKVGGQAFFGAAVDKHKMTLQREQQRMAEYLALAEAFGTWLSKFTGRQVRGAEGFFEDVEDGVVLCRMLSRLGVPVDKPADPPRNAFQAKENMQKFQMAVKKSGFKCIPNVGDTKSLVPTLLEAAAVAAAQNHVLLMEEKQKAQSLGEGEDSGGVVGDDVQQVTTTSSTNGDSHETHHKRKLTIVELPDALIKRTEDPNQAFVGSSILAAATAGTLRAHEDAEFEPPPSPPPPPPPPPSQPPQPPQPITANLPQEQIPAVETQPIITSNPPPPTTTTTTTTTTKSRAASLGNMNTTNSPAPPTGKSRAATVSISTSTPASPQVARVKRAPSEIPQDEKDRMVNLTLMGFFVLLLFYLLFLR